MAASGDGHGPSGDLRRGRRVELVQRLAGGAVPQPNEVTGELELPVLGRHALEVHAEAPSGVPQRTSGALTALAGHRPSDAGSDDRQRLEGGLLEDASELAARAGPGEPAGLVGGGAEEVADEVFEGLLGADFEQLVGQLHLLSLGEHVLVLPLIFVQELLVLLLEELLVLLLEELLILLLLLGSGGLQKNPVDIVHVHLPFLVSFTRSGSKFRASRKGVAGWASPPPARANPASEQG